ncbi:MAG: response regulator [Chloroflexota bacterium]
MAESKVRVFLIHSFPDTASYITALLGLERDFDVVGSALSAKDGLARLPELRPDLILLGAELPDAESAALVRQITGLLPRSGVVVLVGSDDPGDLRRYMQAGARSFLVTPFSSAQLTSTIREVYRRLPKAGAGSGGVVKPAPPAPSPPAGKIVAIFGPKGGVGKTMLAANLAVSIRQAKNRSVVLVDGNFSLGDVHLYLNMKPEHTILDFAERGAEGDLETLQRVVQRHGSGITFLARPERPEHAEMVSAETYRRVIELLASAYDYVVVDCAASYDDRTLLVLDKADIILLIVTPEVGSLINATIFLDLTQVLGYPRDRVRIVLNRHDSQVGISIGDAESALSRPVDFRIPSRGRELASTLNAGVPITIAQPSSDISRAIGQIAEAVTR